MTTHSESEDDQDFSTDLLFEREFIPIALNYEGVRVEHANMGGKALTLLANAVFNSAFAVGEWIDRGYLKFADGCSGKKTDTSANESHTVANYTFPLDSIVLELGAGTGFPTLRLLKDTSISVNRAVITDYPAEEIMITLKKNARENGATAKSNVHVTGLDWYSETDIQHVLELNDGEAYDLIIAADLLWYIDAHAALAHCIAKTLRKPSSTPEDEKRLPRALVPSGTYAKREDVRRFLQLANEAGLKWREMNLDTPFENTPWQEELKGDDIDYQWHGSLDIFWEGEDGRREQCTAANLAERKKTVYAFELQWA